MSHGRSWVYLSTCAIVETARPFKLVAVALDTPLLFERVRIGMNCQFSLRCERQMDWQGSHGETCNMCFGLTSKATCQTGTRGSHALEPGVGRFEEA
ncbi:hypothetical protein CC2G_006515 [Coprinopsis cinerea AmutBmut pab1-1]|nr:hypothetical protein CC2G_006515 [Coprinopsis cinerea AmutBmut pab1-1]